MSPRATHFQRCAPRIPHPRSIHRETTRTSTTRRKRSRSALAASPRWLQPAAAWALGTGTMVGDADPYYDACADGTSSAAQGGRNVGNLLNARGVTWGWFEGGFSSPNYVPGRAIHVRSEDHLHRQSLQHRRWRRQSWPTVHYAQHATSGNRRLLHARLQPPSRTVPVLCRPPATPSTCHRRRSPTLASRTRQVTSTT